MALKGRVALVTGASRGVGGEIALSLARQGVNVAIGYRSNKAGAQRVAAAAQAAGVEAVCYGADITQDQQVKALIEDILNRFSSLDIVVNCAGEFHWKPVAECGAEEWDRVMGSNLSSVFYTCKFALPSMRRQRWGRIVNLGAVGAERAFGQAKIAAYSAAKSAMVAFTRSLALEEAANGITANVVNPSIIDDRNLTRAEAEKITDARFPVGRPSTAEDVATAVKFFLAEEASFVTGQVMNVSGGWLL